MMKLLHWCLLLACVVLYVLVGAGVFMAFEEHLHRQSTNETEIIYHTNFTIKNSNLHIYLEEIIYLEATTKNHTRNFPFLESMHRKLKIAIDELEELTKTQTQENFNYTKENPPEYHNMNWDFYNSAMFAFSIITTIGFGFHTPKSNASRIFSVFYGLFGIPLHMILVRALGDYFSHKMAKVDHFRNKLMAFGNDNLRSIFQIIYYLLLGLLFIIIIPSWLFAGVEKWTFTESFYMAGITCLTIGFGDYVPGMMHARGDVWLWMYKLFIFIWIEIGIGYLMMILTLVTKALKNKKVRHLIQHKVLSFLHFERVSEEDLLEDIEFLQRVLGEPSLIKVKESSAGHFDEVDDHHKIDEHHKPRKVDDDHHNHHAEASSGIDKERKHSPAAYELVHLPHILLSAMVNVVRHGVMQEVYEAVTVDQVESNNCKSNPSTKSPQVTPSGRRRRIIENPQNSQWRLSTLNEGVVTTNTKEFNNNLPASGTKVEPSGVSSDVPVAGDQPGQIFYNVERDDGRASKFSPVQFKRRLNSASSEKDDGDGNRRGRKRRKNGVPNVVEGNVSGNSSGRLYNQNRVKKISLVTPSNIRPPPVQRHLSLQPTLLQDFSRMLDDFQSQLKPIVLEKNSNSIP